VDDLEAAAPPRLAELLAALSLGIDLGFGQPMEHVLRQCRIALRIGEIVGLDESERATLYYTALLVNVGCHSDAHEQARWCGDDIGLRSTKYKHELRSLRSTAEMLRLIGSGNPPLHRLRVAFDFMAFGHKDMDGAIEQHAQLARGLGEMLGLSNDVLAALGSSYERWDGRGWPGQLAGEALPVAARITQLAEFVEVAHRSGGIAAAQALATARSGAQFDPSLVKVICADGEKVFHGIDDVGSWDAVIDAEPALAAALTSEECDEALLAIARFVDLKTPYLLGHSETVADLAARTAAHLGASDEQITAVRRAGLVIGFGRLGVSNVIWDKPGPLATGEWERVRMWPYFTGRMLGQSESLAAVGTIASQHRERLDGSGYPRGISGAAVPLLSRILGTADAYQAMREIRPYRPMRSADEAAAELRVDVRAGRMDGDVVDSVLAVAGHRPSGRGSRPGGLTAREVEVLRLAVLGMSNKQIAAQLVVTPKTVGNHIEHIYTKIGVSNRAAASLYAMQHGLVPVTRR
jgi:HD-GYP domain-containing protein (c-di-GMP phosphodiesterase class II)